MAVDSSTIRVVMPAMGDSVAEGTVLEWRKHEGDRVEVDETIVEISTDKVDAEVPAPVAGTISKIYVAEGETVAVGALLAEISGGGDAAGNGGAAAAPPESAVQPSPHPRSPSRRSRTVRPRRRAPRSTSSRRPAASR